MKEAARADGRQVALQGCRVLPAVVMLVARLAIFSAMGQALEVFRLRQRLGTGGGRRRLRCVRRGLTVIRPGELTLPPFRHPLQTEVFSSE